MIQIIGDPSAERTAPPRSTHVQPGDVSHALIQQGERERLRKTPSSSSTTAWWRWRSVAILQGFAKHRGRGGVLGRGGGLRQNLWCGCPPTPHIYRGKGEGGRPPQIQSEEGAAARGVALPPKARGAPPPFRVPQNPRRMGPRGWRPAHLGLVPFHLQPIRPSGAGGPTRWTLGTPPVVPVQYRYTPEYFR